MHVVTVVDDGEGIVVGSWVRVRIRTTCSVNLQNSNIGIRPYEEYPAKTAGAR